MLEQLRAHSDTARFIAKLHQTADAEQPTNIILCASGARYSGIPASSVGPTVALLAFAEPSAQYDWPCKDNDEEVGLH